DRAGRFIRAVTDFNLAYAARCASEIADDITAIDDAVRWGFARDMGPFEMWDALGVAETIARMEGAGLAVAPWVKEMVAAGFSSFYARGDDGVKRYYDFTTKAYKPVRVRPKALAIDDLKAA